MSKATRAVYEARYSGVNPPGGGCNTPSSQMVAGSAKPATLSNRPSTDDPSGASHDRGASVARSQIDRLNLVPSPLAEPSITRSTLAIRTHPLCLPMIVADGAQNVKRGR